MQDDADEALALEAARRDRRLVVHRAGGRDEASSVRPGAARRRGRRRPAVEQAPVVAEQGGQHLFPVVGLGAGPRRAALRRPIAGEQRRDRFGERRARAALDRQAAGAVGELGQAFGPAHDDRRAAGHRLERRQAEGLLVAGMDEGVGAGEDRRQRGDVGDERNDAHPLARRRHRSGADRQQDVRRAEPRHRVGEHVEMLLGREAAGVDEHARIGGEAELGAPAGRRRALGMERRGVDAERLQRDALHAPVEQVAAHAAARREHEVEAAIDMARVATRRRRGEAAEARAGGEPGHRLEVGVAGRDRRDGERARRRRARPRRRGTGSPASIRSGRRSRSTRAIAPRRSGRR